MEDFPFRPSFQIEKNHNTYLPSAMGYSDAFDPSRASMKMENISGPFQGSQDFHKSRFNPYEAPNFFPMHKEEDYFTDMHDHVKTEAYLQDYPNFGHHQMQTDPSFDFPMATKFQDYSVDYYRINRSRGPSFNLGPGRKNSEDLFAGSFDLLSYFKNHDQNPEKPMLQEPPVDSRLNSHFMDDYKPAPLMHNLLPGNFGSFTENNFHYSFHTPMNVENPIQKDVMMGIPQNVQNHIAYHGKQQVAESIVDKEERLQKYAELEPKGKKKRKLNNEQEAPAPQESELPSSPQLQKSKSESKKTPLTKNSTTPKVPKSKKGITKKDIDNFGVKFEAEERPDKDEKSTQSSSVNVSPYLKKEEMPTLLKSKSSIVGGFGHFKKPETAQELFGGLTVPAEVEEYINNSKIFNQIKAPVVKKIGTLTLEERRAKIEKYLEKRKRRTWNKRVNYDCRKKVADNRLRIKGRFVTKDQAFVMLEACGIFADPEKITNTEIKDLLNERFGAILGKKKENGSEEGNNGEGKMEMKDVQFNTYGMEQETNSFQSHDDSLSENYLKD